MSERLTMEEIEEIREFFKIGSPGRIDILCDMALASLSPGAEPDCVVSPYRGTSVRDPLAVILIDAPRGQEEGK